MGKGDKKTRRGKFGVIVMGKPGLRQIESG